MSHFPKLGFYLLQAYLARDHLLQNGVAELSEVLYFAYVFDQALKDQSSLACECSG